jgi:cell pole-organizing protein PopZ
MASNPQHEPTMEEILASIRKIISEDSSDAQPAPAAAKAPAVEEEEEAEVLELTQEVPHEEPVRAPEPVRLAAVPPAPKPAEPENDIEFQPVEEAPVSSSAAHDDIFSDKTRKAIDETFANIEPPKAEAKSAPASRSFEPASGDSIESVFERAVTNAFDPVLHQWMDSNKDELLAAVKPLIREWMDEHFPALLEGAVRNEVERVVKARGR